MRSFGMEPGRSRVVRACVAKYGARGVGEACDKSVDALGFCEPFGSYVIEGPLAYAFTPFPPLPTTLDQEQLDADSSIVASYVLQSPIGSDRMLNISKTSTRFEDTVKKPGILLQTQHPPHRCIKMPS